MHFCRTTLLIFLLAVILPQSSNAEVGRKTPSRDGTETAGPYYNTASKSYFELIRLPYGSDLTRWRHVKGYIKSRFFKETQARLAIVRDLATHQFISYNFKSPEPFWIGMQYFCKSNTIKWVDGTDVTKSKFSAWAKRWARNNNVRCEGHDHMPVSYTAEGPTKTLRWQATGPEKGFSYFLVEYPTGKE